MTDTFTAGLDSRIEDAAAKLRRNLRDGYTRGYEYDLAGEISKRFTTDDDRKAAICHLVLGDLTGWPMVGGALDECAPESYELMREFADRITDLAWQQMQAEKSDIRLRQLLAREICERQRALPQAA